MTVYKGSAAQSELSQGSNAFAEAYKGGNKVWSKSGKVPTFGTRLNNMCTVIGTITDSTGQELVYAILDAVYRTEKVQWSSKLEDTLIMNVSTSTYRDDLNSATENTDLILNNYNNDEYPAFKLAREAGSIEINGITYYSQLPKVIETFEMRNNAALINSLDPTINTYPNLAVYDDSLRTGLSYVQTCQEQNSMFAILGYLRQNEGTSMTFKSTADYSLIPIFEIPVSAFE